MSWIIQKSEQLTSSGTEDIEGYKVNMDSNTKLVWQRLMSH